MSELNIGLVAEGSTDFVLIHAALKAVLDRAFILTQLQPEPTFAYRGGGWCGVLKWCTETGARIPASLDTDPLLSQFDLLILHIDVDVINASYTDCGTAIASHSVSTPWPALPGGAPCPPANTQAAYLEGALTAWLAPVKPGPKKTVMCLPAQCSGAWLAAAILPSGHTLLSDLECNGNIESQLAGLPIKDRVKKSVRDFQLHAGSVTRNWNTVKRLCPQAAAFENRVLAAI
jgi:hypothetical protein